MNRINRVFAMLAPAGALTGAALVAGATDAATDVSASFTTASGYTADFDLDPTGGVADTADGSGYIDFAITNFTATGEGPTSADLLVLGDAGKSPNLVLANGSPGATWTSAKSDTLSTPAYDGSAATSFDLQPGTYGSPLDSELVVGVPEPETWALLIVGAALVGGAARHRRAQRSAAIA